MRGRLEDSSVYKGLVKEVRNEGRTVDAREGEQ